mgnify:CR=1 FL=1
MSKKENKEVILFFDEADSFLGENIEEYEKNELENLKSLILFLKVKNQNKYKNIKIFMATNNLASLNNIILNESLSLNFPNLENNGKDLLKLDNDFGLGYTDFLTNYELHPTQGVGRKLRNLTILLNSIYLGFTITSGNETFSTIQSEFNNLCPTQ